MVEQPTGTLCGAIRNASILTAADRAGGVFLGGKSGGNDLKLSPETIYILSRDFTPGLLRRMCWAPRSPFVARGHNAEIGRLILAASEVV